MLTTKSCCSIVFVLLLSLGLLSYLITLLASAVHLCVTLVAGFLLLLLFLFLLLVAAPAGVVLHKLLALEAGATTAWR